MQRRSRVFSRLFVAVSLVLAAGVACHGDGAPESSSSRAADPIADFQANLRASLAALPALPVPATTILAATAGVLSPVGSGATSVDDRGVAHQHIPIWVPPGRAGMQPELSLEYASGGANGTVGVGWGLAGLSRITRCKGLRQSGNIAAPILWGNTDAFCIDGEPLVDLDGVNFARFHDDGSLLTFIRTSQTDPGYWRLRTKDGRILTFGGSSNSQVSVDRRLLAPAVMTFALSRVEDRAGNFMTITYGPPTGGDILPQEIDYTGSASDATTRRSVTFAYEPRPDIDQLVVAEQYFTYPQRLASIQMHAPNGAGLDPLRTFSFSYTTSATTGRSLLQGLAECDGPAWAGLCREESFSYAQGTGLGDAFDIYGQDTNGAAITDVSESPQSGVPPTVLLLDVDGDGRDDLLYLSSDADQAYHLRFSTGFGFGPAITTDIAASIPAHLPGVVSGTSAPIVLDFNGDGHADVLVNEGPSTAPYPMLFLANNASGTWTLGGPGYELLLFPNAPPSYVQSADLDGDGRPDFVMMQGDTPSYSLNKNGTVAGLTPPAELPAAGNDYNERVTSYLMDLNGDGVTELVTRRWTDQTCVGHRLGETGELDCFCNKMSYGALDVGSNLYRGFGGTSSGDTSTTLGGLVVCTGAIDDISNYTPLFGDFNGDGIPDVVTMNEPIDPNGNTLPYNLQLSLGGGDQSFTAQTTGAFTLPFTTTAFQAMDVDLDGKADLLVRGYGGPGETPYTLYTWKNQQWVPTVLPMAENPVYYVDDQSLFATGDVNGDGLPDFVAYQGDGGGGTVGSLALYQRRSQGPRADFLTNASGDFGPTTIFKYQPYLVASDEDRSDCQPPLGCVTRGGFVVSEVDVDNGVGGMNAQTHSFAGGRTDLLGWGFLGFKQHTITDVPTGEVTTRRFDFSAIGTGATPFFPFVGMPYEVDTSVVYFSGGQAVTRTSQTGISYHVIGTGPFMALPSVIESQTNDSNASTPIAQKTTSCAYDPFGNRIYQSDTYLLDGETRTTTAEYLDDTVNWIMGRPTYVSTTSTTRTGQAQTRETAYTYDALGQLAVQIDNPGARDNGSYDPLPTQSDGVQTLYTRTTRDSNGLPRVVDQLDSLTTPSHIRETSYVYDPFEGMYVALTIDPALLVTLTAYEPGLGVLAVKLDSTGVLTTYQYDTFGRILADHPTGGGDRVVAYHAPTAGNHGSIDDHHLGQLGHTETLDSLRRTVASTTTGRADGKAVSTETTFDVLGHAHTVSRPHFAGVTPAVTTTTYDNLGRVINVAGADGSSISTSYVGLQVTSTNADGDVSMVTNDSLARPVTSVQATTPGPSGLSGHVTTTTLGYGPFDTVISSTDTVGDVTRSTYDRRGRLLWKLDLDTAVTAYTYDVFGDVTDLLRGASLVTLFFGGHATQVISGGTDTHMTYDSDARMLTKTAPDVGQTFTYDTVMPGKLSSATVTGGTTIAYTYDGSGNVKTKKWSGPRGAIGYTYSYDQYNRLSTTTYPPLRNGNPSLIVQNTYSAGDVGGQLTEVDDVTTSPMTTYWKLVSTDASDAFPVADLASNVVMTFGEDPAHPGWLSTITSTQGPTTVQSLEYTREGAGRVHERDDLVHGLTETFGYDGLERLTSWSWTGPVGQRGVQYVYDDLGNLHLRNITAGPGTSLTYTYGGTDFGPHQVASDGSPTAFAYDAQGNQLVAPGRSFAWNSFDRPTSVTAAAGTYALVYDADLARFSRTDPAGNTRYTYGGLFEEYSDTAGTHDVMTISAGTRPVGEIEKVVKGNNIRSTTKNTLLVDALGSIDTIVTSNGPQPIKYDPFGTRVNETDPTVAITAPPQDLRAGFTGHDHDDDLDLIDMIGRVYDPKQQRFLSIDPAAPISKIDSQAYNPYAYVRNNPLNATDPTGYLELTLGGLFWKTTSQDLYGQYVSSGYATMTYGDPFGHAIIQGVFGTDGPDVTLTSPNVSLPGIPGTYAIADMELQVKPMDWSGLAADIAPSGKASSDDIVNYFVSVAWMSAVSGHDVQPTAGSISRATVAQWTETLVNNHDCGSCLSAALLNAAFLKWAGLGSNITIGRFVFSDGTSRMGHAATRVTTDQGERWLEWARDRSPNGFLMDLNHAANQMSDETHTQVFVGFDKLMTPEQAFQRSQTNEAQVNAPASCMARGLTSNPYMYSPTVVFIRGVMNGL